MNILIEAAHQSRLGHYMLQLVSFALVTILTLHASRCIMEYHDPLWHNN